MLLLVTDSVVRQVLQFNAKSITCYLLSCQVRFSLCKSFLIDGFIRAESLIVPTEIQEECHCFDTIYGGMHTFTSEDAERC